MATKTSYLEKLHASISCPSSTTIFSLVLYGILIYGVLLTASNKQHVRLSPGECIAIIAIMAGAIHAVRVGFLHKLDRS